MVQHTTLTLILFVTITFARAEVPDPRPSQARVLIHSGLSGYVSDCRSVREMIAEAAGKDAASKQAAQVAAKDRLARAKARLLKTYDHVLEQELNKSEDLYPVYKLQRDMIQRAGAPDAEGAMEQVFTPLHLAAVDAKALGESFEVKYRVELGDVMGKKFPEDVKWKDDGTILFRFDAAADAIRIRVERNDPLVGKTDEQWQCRPAANFPLISMTVQSNKKKITATVKGTELVREPNLIAVNIDAQRSAHLAGLLRVIPLLTSKKGHIIAFPHFIECTSSPTVNVMEGHAGFVVCHGPDTIAGQGKTVRGTRYEVYAGQERFFVWIDGKSKMPAVLMFPPSQKSTLRWTLHSD